MKKVILFAAILFAGVSVVKAQNKTSHTPTEIVHLTATQAEAGNLESTTNLKVTLNSIMSVSVNTSDIHLEYKTVDDYDKGVETGLITNHLSVYSTGGYTVSVKYGNPITDNYSDNNPTAATAASNLFETIKVVVKNQKSADLSTDGAEVITSTEGGMNVMYDVNYVGLGGDKYRDFIENNTTRVYTADVTYTIAPN